MLLKRLSVLALLAVAACSFGKSFVIPHVLERSGLIVGVGWDCDGAELYRQDFGQVKADRHTECRVAFSPETNPGIIDDAIAGIMFMPDSSKPGPMSIH